jgi:LuxR family maltose regulon positive regulatory protein
MAALEQTTLTNSRFPLTKFRVPRGRGDTIPRSRLLARLGDSVASNPVTLVCAPAGSGKTTALLQLAASLRDAYAVLWLAVDPEDNDTNRLFAALVEVFEPLGLTWDIEPHSLVAGVAGVGAQSRAALAALVNALCTSEAERIVLIVDDLHRIERPDAFALLESLIERLPDHVALVFGSRVEPPLPLARWRAHGELGEITPLDLRFDEAEAQALAAVKLGLHMDSRSVKSVLRRTHGWAVGLTMALQARQNERPAEVGADATQRNLFAYLAQEILAELPADLRDFMLESSILDELNPSMCRAVTGRADAASVLDGLYRRSLFVTVIDETAPVLRFHDLFRDFLRTELARRRNGELRELHAKAAQAEGCDSRAVHHYLEAQRWGEALERILLIGESLLAEGGVATIERWLEQIPESFRAGNACVSYLRGTCAWLRWDWARAKQELAPAVAALTAPTEARQRVAALFQLVDALNSSGDLEGAWRRLEQVAREPLDELGFAELALQRAWCLAPNAEPAAVLHHMREFIAHAERDPERICPVTAGRIHCMLVGLPGISACFERFVQLAERVKGPAGAPWHLAVFAIDGWTRLWRGDRAGAEAALARAEALYHQFGSVRLMAERIGQFKAYFNGAVGNLAVATAVGREHIAGLEAPEVAWHRAVWERSYRHAFARFSWIWGDAESWFAQLPHLVAPRRPEEWPFTDQAADVARGQAAIFRRNWTEAIEALERATASYSHRRMAGIYCDPRVSLAYAHLARGDRRAAWRAFEPAWAEIVEENALGILVLDSRAHVAALLDALPEEVRGSNEMRSVRARLAEWGAASPDTAGDSSAGRRGQADASPVAGPLAALTEREREVLAQVASGASNKHVARTLDLSLHTVKRHIANILDKLDCASRGEAADLFRRHS